MRRAQENKIENRAMIRGIQEKSRIKCREDIRYNNIDKTIRNRVMILGIQVKSRIEYRRG